MPSLKAHFTGLPAGAFQKTFQIVSARLLKPGVLLDWRIRVSITIAVAFHQKMLTTVSCAGGGLRWIIQVNGDVAGLKNDVSELERRKKG